MKMMPQIALTLAACLAADAFAATNEPQTFPVAGTVVDAAGNPVAGATVGYWRLVAQPPLPSVWEQKEQATTSANGSFAFQMLRGTALILARKPGLAPAWTPSLNPANTLPEQRVVLVAPAVLAGKVVDETGKPVPDVPVFVTRAQSETTLEDGARRVANLGGQVARECFSAHTGVDGRFRITGFPTNATADLLVEAPGKALRLPTRDAFSPDNLMCHAGQEDIELVVEPAGSIEGKVVAEDTGEPLSKVMLLLQAVQVEGLAPVRLVARDPALSGADGAFRIPDVPDGSYRLRAVFGTNTFPDRIAEIVSVSVESAQPTRDVKVVASRGGVLEVAVLDKKDRKPVAQASIDAYAPTYQATGTSGDNGIARLRLTPGDYRITGSRQNWQSDTTSATVESGKTNRVDLELSPPQRITGVVHLPDGKPAAGLPVGVLPGYQPSARGNQTDANGKFDLEWNSQRFGPSGITPCLLIRDPERNLAVALDLEEDTGPLDLKLEPGLTLVGRVECDGKPLTNATAALIFWTGRSGMWVQGLARTNVPGRFEIPALPPGRRYGVVVSAPGYGQKNLSDISAAAEAGRQELDLVELKPANLKVAGQVLDADDKPVARISVSLSGNNQPSANTRTDREGRFHFDHVAEGPVQLYASALNNYGNITAEGGDTNVVLRLGQTISSSPDAVPQKVKGTVTDPNGKPVAGAQVSVFPTSGRVGGVKTGTNGAFSLTWSLPPWQLRSGNPLLVVRHLARNLAAAEELPEDTTNLDVQLKPAVTLAGRVETPEGSPLTNAQVGLWLHAGSSYDQLNDQPATTGAHGRFEIKGLPVNARYLAFASDKGRGRYLQDVQPDAETNRVELDPFILRPADKLLAGQVLDQNDKPVSGASVSTLNVLAAGDAQPEGNTTTDSKGRFRLQLCEGQVRLYASSSSGNGYAQITAEAGDTNVEVRFGSSSSVVSEAPRRPSLKGRPLPDLTALGFAAEALPANQPLLLCLADVDQRPSRRAVRLLAEQNDALRQKGVNVLAAQAALTTEDSFKQWKDANPVPFAVGRVAEKLDKVKWATEVESFPWLILTDAKGRVAAEGFALEELDAKLQTLSK